MSTPTTQVRDPLAPLVGLAATDVGLWAALLADAAWALVPAAAGLVAVQRRDVV